MRSNTKIRYGLRTMIQIALDNQAGIYQKDISAKQDISVKYLDQIIACLKAHGLIQKPQDQRIGYVLAKDASSITVYDIYQAFETDLKIVPCLPEEGTCKRKGSCVAEHFWSGLNQNIKNHLSATSLQMLADEQRQLNLITEKT
ncbi:MAG: RrF2 family transcriptional regulator [Bacteroidota bacterium]